MLTLEKNMMSNWKKLLLLIAALSVGCKKPYNPPVTNSPNSYLVVEGVINTNGTTAIKLSRTVNLSSKVTTNPVTGALLFVEGDGGYNGSLSENDNGYYYLAAGTLDNSQKYRLRIKTPDNKEYLSDFEQVKVTPPVDSIGFTITGNKLNIYANTHDPNNNTRYYRFNYHETWRFHAQYTSAFIADGSDVRSRHADEYIYDCFADDTSSTIILGSSAKLKEDMLYQLPITSIVSTSEKIETKYSILLNQYALSADAYKFWTNLKKNTEQLGSIFDAEPSQLMGNIHNTANPAEPVIGYITVSTVQSKRIFIEKNQLPLSFQPVYPFNCELDTLWYSNPHTQKNDVQYYLLGTPPLYLPSAGVYAPGVPKPIAYLSSSRECLDCTIRGYKQQPEFWK
ncbi:MAG: DUF4249 domain-containing protein [Mucilaginibacter sp.]